MAIRRFSTSTIVNNLLRYAKFWDQTSTFTAAPTNSYFPIASYTVPSGGLSSVTFAGLPQTFTHLQIRYLVKNSSDSYQMAMQFNGVTSSDYFWHILNGNGSSATANGYTSQTYIGLPRTAPTTANVFYVGVVDILDYTSVVKNKTVKGLGGGDNNSAGHVDFTSGTWNNSSTAISSIKLNATTGNLAEYTNISIYGVN